MRTRLILAALLISAGLAPADAADTRTLTRSLPAGSISHLVVESGIGDVTIQAVPGATEISIEVVLTPRRGGIFSSKRKAEQEVDAASLSSVTKGDRLELTIKPEADDDRRFEENWSITMPTTVSVKLEHGV